MTREEKLYSMRMADLVNVADKLGIKINTKAAKSAAIEKILAAEEMNKQNEKELKKEEAAVIKPENIKTQTDFLNAVNDILDGKAIVKPVEAPKLVPMPGAEKLAELKAETTKRSKKNNMIEYNGKTQNLTQWAKELDMPVQTLYYRIKMKGWDVEKAFTK